MTLPMKPESVALLYEYLRSLPPFARRKLPHADDVEFAIVKDRSCYAKWSFNGERHRISVSDLSISQSVTLLMYLGHEMCHVAVDIAGHNTGGNVNCHNAAFRRLAASFCKIHGLDVKAFY